jgi:hypothetical protein
MIKRIPWVYISVNEKLGSQIAFHFQLIRLILTVKKTKDQSIASGLLNAGCSIIFLPNSGTKGIRHSSTATKSSYFPLYATMVEAVADSYFQVGGRTPTVL